MSLDFQRYLHTAERSVTEHERDGEPVRSVILARSYDTTADDLWDAVTSPERLPRWFLPVSGELKPGGRYQLEGNAGGTITKCDPPRLLAATWEFGGGMSWIEVRIAAEADARSHLTLEHICPIDEHWEQFGPGAAGVGWDLGLLGLGLHISSPDAEPVDPMEFMSGAGQPYIVAASEDWGRAAIEAGEDPEHARAAAKRTTAFYTGAEVPEQQ